MNAETTVIEMLEGRNENVSYSQQEKFAVNLSCLSKKEQEILIRLYGLDGNPPETPSEISEKVKISIGRISQLKKDAIAKLCRGMKTAADRIRNSEFPNG